MQIQPDDADFDTLDLNRASIRWMTNASPVLRRDRPEPRRPAQRRDPRRRHRHREPVVAHHPRDPGPGADRRRRREPVRRAAAHRARAAPARLRPLLQLRGRGRRADGLRARRARGARRPRPRQPRGGGLRRGLPEGRDDARGRAHARPAPQLPLVARLHPEAARRPGVHPRERHHRLGDGLRADQPQRPGRAARLLRHAVQRHPRPLRLLGDRVRLQAAARRPQPGRGEGGAGEDRRAQRRAAARLRHRRGQLPRHRSRVAADRPGQRRHRLRQEADRDRPGPAEAPGSRASSGPTRTTTC